MISEKQEPYRVLSPEGRSQERKMPYLLHRLLRLFYRNGAPLNSSEAQWVLAGRVHHSGVDGGTYTEPDADEQLASPYPAEECRGDEGEYELRFEPESLDGEETERAHDGLLTSVRALGKYFSDDPEFIKLMAETKELMREEDKLYRMESKQESLGRRHIDRKCSPKKYLSRLFGNGRQDDIMLSLPPEIEAPQDLDITEKPPIDFNESLTPKSNAGTYRRESP